MSVGKARKDNMSMEAKATKVAKVEEEPAMSAAAKTHKVDSASMPFGSAKADKEMSVAKAEKVMSVGKASKVHDAKAEKNAETSESMSMLAKSNKGDSAVDYPGRW